MVGEVRENILSLGVGCESPESYREVLKIIGQSCGAFRTKV